MPVLKTRQRFGVTCFGRLLQGFVGREGISFLLQLFGAHEAMLTGFEAYEAELFLKLEGSEHLEIGVGEATGDCCGV